MNPRLRILMALWLVFAGSVGSPTPCLADSPVALRGDVELKRETVRLGDLFSGVPAGIDRDIAQAPPPGQQAVYDANLLAKLADKYRLDWLPQNGADHVTVTSGFVRITTDSIRDAIVASLKDNGVRGEVSIAYDGRPPVVDLPANQSTAFSLVNFDYNDISKRFHTDLVAETGHGPMSLPIAGRITVRQRVPVLAHRLEGGAIIGANDLDWAEIPEDRINVSVVTGADQLVGRELRRATSEGEILHANDVLPPRLVTRGSLVTMQIETPFMTITAQGKALEDGAMGESVRVLNTSSNRMIGGTVTAAGTVTVAATRQLASAR